MQPYPQKIETQMRRYYESLSEKDARRYAAIEALKLGHGGRTYICNIFGCNLRTIARGIQELNNQPTLEKDQDRIRKPGGGRKRAIDTIDGINEAFFRAIGYDPAEAMTDNAVKWTHLTRQQIADRLKINDGIKVSVTIIDQLISLHRVRRHP